MKIRTVYLKTQDNYYVSANEGGGLLAQYTDNDAQQPSPISTDQSKIVDSTTWILQKTGNDTYNIRSYDGAYISAIGGGGRGLYGRHCPLFADVHTVKNWETFDLYILKETNQEIHCAIRTVKGYFLCSTRSKDENVANKYCPFPFNCKVTEASSWETFTIKDTVPNHGYATIKAKSQGALAYFLSTNSKQKSNTLNQSDPFLNYMDHRLSWESFQFKPSTNGTWKIQTSDQGHFLQTQAVPTRMNDQHYPALRTEKKKIDRDTVFYLEGLSNLGDQESIKRTLALNAHVNLGDKSNAVYLSANKGGGMPFPVTDWPAKSDASESEATEFEILPIFPEAKLLSDLNESYRIAMDLALFEVEKKPLEGWPGHIIHDVKNWCKHTMHHIESFAHKVSAALNDARSELTNIIKDIEGDVKNLAEDFKRLFKTIEKWVKDVWKEWIEKMIKKLAEEAVEKYKTMLKDMKTLFLKGENEIKKLKRDYDRHVVSPDVKKMIKDNEAQLKKILEKGWNTVVSGASGVAGFAGGVTGDFGFAYTLTSGVEASDRFRICSSMGGVLGLEAEVGGGLFIGVRKAQAPKIGGGSLAVLLGGAIEEGTSAVIYFNTPGFTLSGIDVAVDTGDGVSLSVGGGYTNVIKPHPNN